MPMTDAAGIKMLFAWVTTLLYTVQGENQLTLFPENELRKINSINRIVGGWKLSDIGSGTTLDLRIWTKYKSGFTETGCDAWRFHFNIADEAPSLPKHLWWSDSESTDYTIIHKTDSWMSDSILIENITISDIETIKNHTFSNEKLYKISFKEQQIGKEQYLFTWFEPTVQHKDLTLSQQIERKLHMSTTCIPMLQFNLTRLDDGNELELENDTTPSMANFNTTGWKLLSRNVEDFHFINYFINATDGMGARINCSEVKNSYRLDIKPGMEVGGTLDIRLFNATATALCLSQTGNSLDTCDQDNELFELHHNKSIYVAKPRPGQWFLDFGQVQCNEDAESAWLNVTLRGCPDDCGDYEDRGYCRTYLTPGNIWLSTCTCKAGYEGESCSSDVNSMSLSEQLMELLLLTLSNIFFLPAVIVSLYRRYWTEAVLFIFTMFISAMYHACDQNDTQKFYCMVEYDTLQFADFLASTAAIWVTVLLVADLPARWNSMLVSSGMLIFAIMAHYDRFSGWLYAMPVIIGIIILTTNWVYQCKQRRDCYPPKKAWCLHLVPGLLFAIAGGLVKILFEFDGPDGNYFWTHSIWHACMGLSCAFLLPEVSYDATKMFNPNSENNLISYYKSFNEVEPNDL